MDDGSGVLLLSLNADKSFDLSRIFNSPGQFVVEVAVTDDDGGVGTGTILVEVLPSNSLPVCSSASSSVGLIWPPDHQFVPVNILGINDPDGDPIFVTIDGIWQDEPVDTTGDGSFTPDGQGVGTNTAEVRAERTGTKAVPGNGRVYHIFFTANDGQGGSCSGEVSVGVPHDQGRGSVPIDDGALYDSTAR
ncbi:MAG: hypothetical protein IIC26_01505 [Chloroflexi bacterium]|nr:hypothetical protein [Chloroflexota bacterium]